MILQELTTERADLAYLEASYHEAKVLGFMNDRQSKTVKEKEFVGEYAALNLHKDLLLARAKVRSLEDRLKVALWLDPRQEQNLVD